MQGRVNLAIIGICTYGSREVEFGNTWMFSLVPGMRVGRDRYAWFAVGGGVGLFYERMKQIVGHSEDVFPLPIGELSFGYLFAPTKHFRHGPELILGTTTTLQYTMEWGSAWEPLGGPPLVER